MSSGGSSRAFEARLLLGSGFALFQVALLAAGWEVLALQPPDSPLHAGILAGPIAQLASFAFALGVLCLIAASVWRELYAEAQGRWVAWLLVVGALVQVVALFIAARRGVLAVQLLDPRADVRWLLYARALGILASSAALLGLLVRSVRR